VSLAALREIVTVSGHWGGDAKISYLRAPPKQLRKCDGEPGPWSASPPGVIVASLLPECATPPLADTPVAAGADLETALFAALFGQAVTEAPAEQTGPEEKKQEDAQAAPGVLPGFTVPLAWRALEAPPPDAPLVASCGDSNSGPPDALAVVVEPIPPGKTDLPLPLPESLGVSPQGAPAAQAGPSAPSELAFAALLEAAQGGPPPRDRQAVSAPELPPTVPRPEPGSEPVSPQFGPQTAQPASPASQPIPEPGSQPVSPPSGPQTAQPASPASQPIPEPGSEPPQPASPDRRPAPLDRQPVETRSATSDPPPERRRAIEPVPSPKLSPASAGIWEPHPGVLRDAPAPDPPREPATAPSEPSAVPRNAPKPEVVRDLALVIPGRVSEGMRQESIQVRLMDRSGEVRVAVHTGDSQLAHSLRGQLGELVTRLEQAGYRTQTWQPVEAAAGAPRIGNGRQPAGPQTSSGFGRGNSNSGGQEARQQPRDSQDQPEWVRSLAGAGIKPFLGEIE